MTRYCKVLPLLLLWCGNSCQKVSSVSATQPTASLLQMETIPRTPERLARGKYLVEGVLQCFTCHSEIDFTQRPFQIKPGTKGGGHVFANIELDLPEPNRVVAPNISPDPDYGAGEWRSEEHT